MKVLVNEILSLKGQCEKLESKLKEHNHAERIGIMKTIIERNDKLEKNLKVI